MWKFAAGKFNVRKIFLLLTALALLLAGTPAAAGEPIGIAPLSEGITVVTSHGPAAWPASPAPPLPGGATPWLVDFDLSFSTVINPTGTIVAIHPDNRVILINYLAMHYAGGLPASGAHVALNSSDLPFDWGPAWSLTISDPIIIPVVNSAQLTSALTAIGNGTGTIQLGASFGPHTTPVEINGNITLDLNGETLGITTGNSTNGININTGTTMTIMDSGTGGTLNVTNNANFNSTGHGAAINTTGATLNIQSGTVNAQGGLNGAGIGGGSLGAGGTININGGTVSASAGTGSAAGIGGGNGNTASGNITIGSAATVTANIAIISDPNSNSIGAGVSGTGVSGAVDTITIPVNANLTVNASGNFDAVTLSAPTGGGTVTQGAITGNISATATRRVANPIVYRLYQNSTNANTGGTLVGTFTSNTGNAHATPAIAIPTGLTQGTYYFYIVAEVQGQGPSPENWEAARTATVQVVVSATAVPITNLTFNSVTANSTSGTTTTKLTLNFSADPALTLGNISISNGVTATNLQGTGSSRTVGISGNWTDGQQVTVTVTSPLGFNITPPSRPVTLHRSIYVSGGDDDDYYYEYEEDEEGRRRRRRRHGCDAGFGMAALVLVAAFAVRRRG